MHISLEDKVIWGHSITEVIKEKDCVVYRIQDTTGEGTMTCYTVFSGIKLVFNDFHMTSCVSEFRPNVEMLAIDHCQEGRIEWEFVKDSYTYLQQGDMQINSKEHHEVGFSFPLSHYHGITVAIYIEDAKKSLAKVLEGFTVDVRALRDKFCCAQKPFIVRAKDSIDHIFSELYTVPDTIKISYYKIKVLELLLFLSGSDISGDGEKRAYFPKKQVEIVKVIMNYMIEHIDKHFTLEELSLNFNIPLTTMKNCFKGVYGASVYAYMRVYRIQTAATMLKKTDKSITDIASAVGYSNPSKFAAAFRDIMDMSPTEYKKNFV